MDNFESLKGKTLTTISPVTKGVGEVTFTDSEGNKYLMYHSQSCCESVWLEDAVGDVEDVINTPIIEALKLSNVDAPELPFESDEVSEWTYYELRTIKGSLQLRWYGTSNGYYSTEVTFKKVL